MTISATTNRATYTGNGATTEFAFSYPFHAQADLVVISTVIATGVQTTKALTTHYTISGSTDSLGHYSSGGTVTFLTAPASTERITIYRDPARTQTMDLIENDNLPAETVEAQFDYVTLLIQRLGDMFNRALRQPEGDPADIGRIPALVDRKAKLLGFNSSTGEPEAVANVVSGTEVTATGSTTARTLADWWADWANVLAFGAVGDGTTNDYASVQAAIDSLGARGGIVFFPYGDYVLGTELDVPSGVTLWGVGTLGHQTSVSSATILRASHSSGSVIRVTGQSVRIKDLEVSSTSVRYAGAAGSNYGVRVEAADTAGASVRRLYMENVRVTQQPNHGLLLIGNINPSTLFNVDVDNVDGHGFVINSGTLTSRTNISRPGQINFINCRSSRTGGHALVAGQPGTTDVNDIPYRLILNNFECFYNNVDPAIPYVDYVVYAFGDNIEFSGSAFGGAQESDGADVHGGVYIEGKFIRMINNRYVDNNPYIAEVGNRASYPTVEVTFEGGFIDNTSQGAGFYNPAILVDTGARNVTARFHTTDGNVTSLMATTSINPEVDYKDAKTLGRSLTVTGTVTAQTSTVTPKVQITDTVLTLADDAAAYLTFSAVTRGVIVISGNTAAAKGGIVHFRVGDASAHATVMANSGGDVTGTTGTLAGTTGTDTHLTISADTATNRLYIENRTGGSRAYTFSILNSENGIYQSTTAV